MAELNIRPKTGSDGHVWLWAVIIVAIVIIAIFLLTR